MIMSEKIMRALRKFANSTRSVASKQLVDAIDEEYAPIPEEPKEVVDESKIEAPKTQMVPSGRVGGQGLQVPPKIPKVTGLIKK